MAIRDPERGRVVEDRAAAAAAFVLEAKAQRLDSGQRQQTRDFDLVFDDGHREPLEVTQHSHEPSRRTRARLPDGGFDADELDEVWTVWIPEYAPGPPDRPYDVAACLREIVPVLAAMEEAGIDRFDDQSLWTDVRLRPFAPTVASLGIYGARSLGPRGENAVIKPLFLRQYARRERGMGLQVIADAVETEAADHGNRQKLAGLPDAVRRHLFLRVDLSAVDCYSAVRQAFESGHLPPEPQLPSPITTAWVATSTEVFVITPPGRWEAHGIPLDVNDHPELWLLDPAG